MPTFGSRWKNAWLRVKVVQFYPMNCPTFWPTRQWIVYGMINSRYLDLIWINSEDRQESFFLSETSKYLFLLFDLDNPLHEKAHESRFVFTTEGHLIPINEKIRTKVWEGDFSSGCQNATLQLNEYESDSDSEWPPPMCQYSPSKYNLPIRSEYLSQVFSQVGIQTF